MMMQEQLLSQLINGIKRIFSLMNQDFSSPTCGCFDKSFWYYKIKAFPNGMAQNYAYSLALFLQIRESFSKLNNFEAPAISLANNLIEKPLLIDYIERALIFNFESQHSDGSCDEYYYYERSVVATSFSLLSTFKSLMILLQFHPEFHLSACWEQLLRKKLLWLQRNDDEYPIANHLAGTCLTFIYGFLYFKESKFLTICIEKLHQLFRLQQTEGWFSEYSGFDFGYNTLTLSFLSEIYAKLNEFPPEFLEKFNLKSQMDNIKKESDSVLMKFMTFFQQISVFCPELNNFIGSRRTNHFFISGFLRMREISSNNSQFYINVSNRFIDRFRMFYQADVIENIADDMFYFFLFNDLNEYLISLLQWKYSEPRPLNLEDQAFMHLKNAKIIFAKNRDNYLAINFNQGLTFEINSLKSLPTASVFSIDRLIDTGVLIELPSYTRLHSFQLDHIEFQAVTGSDNKKELLNLEIRGNMQYLRDIRISPLQQLILYIAGMSILKIRAFGRWIKKKLVHRMITGYNSNIYFVCNRKITVFSDYSIQIVDIIRCPQKFLKQMKLFLSHGINTIYVPSSENFIKQRYAPLEPISLKEYKEYPEKKQVEFRIDRHFSL